MRITRSLLLLLSFVALASACASAPHSQWAAPGSEGGLVYRTTEKGDRIPDFSYCGYRGGGVALPQVPVKLSMGPVDGDNRRRIQDAIEHLSALPVDEEGFRGALLLKKGRYEVGDTLRIAASGVVLRGEGMGPGGTVLVATKRERHDLIVVEGEGNRKMVGDTKQAVAQAYVPVGAMALRLASTEGFSVGDCVVVERPSTAEWIHAIGMDRIEHNTAAGLKGEQQWRPGKYNLRFERAVAAILGDKITLDAPLCNSLDTKYGGGWVYRYEHPGRIERVGVESIRCVSEFDASVRDPRQEKRYGDEKHGWRAVTIDRAEDCWVREVTALHFGYACVEVRYQTRRVTVQDCAYLAPVSIVTGARRYSFNLKGAQALVQRCIAENGRHDYVMHSRAPGPNVFLDSLAILAFNDSGPHHRWSVGTLYDNLRIERGPIRIQDRGDWGGAHGWAGANQVVWNCESDKGFVVQSPPTAQNWAIGCVGPRAKPRLEGRPEGVWESHGAHVAPRSLYLAQLEARLGEEAVEAIATAAQRDGTIYEALRDRAARLR